MLTELFMKVHVLYMYIYHHVYVHALKMLSFTTSKFSIFQLKYLYVIIWFINYMPN